MKTVARAGEALNGSPAGAPRVLLDVRGRMGAYAAPLPAAAEEQLLAAGRLAGLGPQHELSVLLTDNPRIHQLNLQWRGKDQPTDVLSFPLHTLKAGAVAPPGALGDIVVSLPYLRRAAAELCVPLQAHLARLLIHGLLHLLGYDHESERDARRMEREESRLLAAVCPPTPEPASERNV